MDTTEPSRFLMVTIADLSRVTALLADRQLRLRDAGVLLALMAHMDTHTCRIRVSTAQLAEDLQMARSSIQASIARLKKQHLLRLVMDTATDDRFLLLNPHVIYAGKSGAVGLAKKQFAEA